jgi:hypothetical protein
LATHLVVCDGFGKGLGSGSTSHGIVTAVIDQGSKSVSHISKLAISH